MANDIKKKFTVDLEITTDNAEKQLKQTATNMKKMFAEIGSASDKIGYLREVVGYLEQVDAWLTKLQEQDPQAFKKALKSMDKDLAHGLVNIFGTSKTDLQMLDQLATQINSIDAKSSTTEVKKLAKAVNELFKSVGQEPKLDIDGMFSGKADVKQKMKRQLALNKAFKEFIALWADASAQNIGNLMPGGASGGSGVADAVATDNKELEKQVKKLQGIAAAYQETLAIFDGKNAGRKTTPQNDVATLKKLKESFEQALDSVRKFEAAGNTASNEYKKAVANAMRAATLFKNTRDYLFSAESDKGSDKASQLATDYAPIAKQARQYIEKLKKSDIFKEVRAYVEQQITNINAKLQKLHEPDGGQSTASDGAVTAQQKRNEDLASSYDKLTAKVNEYIDVQKQLKTLEKGSQARKDALAHAGQIQNDILSMKDLDNDKEDNVYAIFEEMNAGAISSTDAVAKLCGILQIDMLQSAKVATATASVSFDQVGKHAVNATEYIHGMTLALKEMFKVMSKPAEIEYKMSINGQSIDVLKGQFEEIDSATTAAAYLASLKNGMVVDAHSHMGKSPTMNHYDFRQVMDTFYGGVSKVGATVGSNEIATWNLAGVALEDAYKALEEIKKMEEKVGSVGAEDINRIFKAINPAYTGVAKTWQPEQFGDLAQFIHDIGQQSENAISPVERFQNIIKMFAKNVDLSKYTDLINNVTQDNAAGAFNEIMRKENIRLSDGSLLQVGQIDIQTIGDVTKAIEEQRQKFEQNRAEAKLTYAEIASVAEKYFKTMSSKNKEGLDFFTKYFHASEMPEINKLFEEVSFGQRDLTGATNAIAAHFGIDPVEIDQIDTAKAKMQEFLTIAKTYGNVDYISENDVSVGIKKLEEMKAELIELSEQGKLTTKDLEEMNSAFDVAKTHLGQMDHYNHRGSGYGDYSYTYESEFAAAQTENERLREQNAALRADNDLLRAHVDTSAEEAELDDLDKENGLLEEKLERLQDIAAQYGITVTQRDRNRYEELVDKENEVGLTQKEEDRQFELGEKIKEADEAMEELGETYEKIILKLENGKKIEILPDDKGLRALDKIANEYYEGQYNEHEITDVIFKRVQVQADAMKVAGEAAQEVTEKGVQAHQENAEAMAEESAATQEVIDKKKELYKAIEDVNAASKKASQTKLGIVDGTDSDGVQTLDLIKEKIDAFESGDRDLNFEYGKDASYYDQKIQDVQELIALKEEYYAISGINDDDERWSVEVLKQDFVPMFVGLKEAAQNVSKLKSELQGLYPDIDFSKNSMYADIFDLLGLGQFDYAKALGHAKAVYLQSTNVKKENGVDVAQEAVDKLKRLRDEIDALESKEGLTSFAHGKDESYYGQKIQDLQKLIALKKEYYAAGGTQSGEDIGNLEAVAQEMMQLKDGAKNIKDVTDGFEQYLDNLQQAGKFDLLDKSDSANYNQVLAEIKDGTLTTIDQCIAKFEELTASAKTTKAYDDIFEVLHNVGNQWKDLDTVDSAVGSIPLSDIDTYVKELERLVKLIESVDPNFQYGDKNEYDGAVKTLEKLQTLSDRTKLTDEFKDTINQFEQLGKFQWSDELTNGYVKILEDIRNGTYKTIGQCVAKFNELSAAAAEPPLMDTTTAFKELVNYISKSGFSPASFFDQMEGSALKANDALKQIFKSLNLIDENGKVALSSLKSGFTNKGGFVSDQYTMIARPDYYLGKIQSIQPKLQQAQKEGAQIGAIFDIIEDKAKGVIYEIQNTVPGESVLGHHSGKTNMDILNASEAHIDGLVNTLQILAKNGLFVDWGGDNVLYDPQKGFSIIDMGDKGDKHFTVSAQNTLQENLDRMVKEMFDFASPDMQKALQDGVVKNLYASAQKIDASIVNPYAPKQTRTAKDAQAASAKTAAAVQREEDAHEDNTAAIKAENDALQAQIELKKKAQSMKWEAFATDDSLAALKQAAGMKTLGQLEGFWKTSNYEKQIDFHEISESDAKQIFKDKLPKGLASKWYGSADFLAKSQLENEILADPEIRNAAMSYFWHIFKNSYVSSKYPNVKTFDDFINNEFTMYRGDQAPLIYDPSSKLSFSINESTANGFNSNLGTIKIKPKDTIGNAGSVFTSELETFAPSEQTSWFQKNREAFADFYAKQTKEMQKELDAGFVNFEKKRISDIIGDNLSTMTHKALQSSYWQHNVADDLKNGIVPNQLVVPTDGSDYAQFATMYNSLSDTMKRFVMFFASMDELSASLPKPFSISVPTAGGGFKYGKNAVGAGAELFNAVLNDPEGRHQHIARLTGEKAFNLMGVTPAEINAVADAHERNAQAINAEAQAQKDLNSLQDRYDMVMDDLWDSAVDADGSKHNDLSKLWSQLYDVQHSDQDLVNQGLYTQKSTGQSVDATDLFQLVVDIESKYNENLDYVKDYLTQVYRGIDFEGTIPQPTSAYENTKTKTYEMAKSAYKSGNQREYFKILGVLNHLNDVEAADADDIAIAQYTDTDTGRKYDVSKLLGMVKSIEDAYGENFDYVYDYLKQVYGEATIDDALSNLDKNGQDTTRRAAKQYTTADYEAAYAAAPADMQAAIDDLAVFQQRYEQLYALTNTQPIDIMFPGKPTLNEVDEVMAAFDEFKSKQRQIFQLQMLDYDGNKEKIQELQAEAVGLQNKLRDASLGENADISEYKLTYGFTDDQDAERFKNLVDMTESVHTVINDLTRIGEHKMSLIPQEMQDMLDSDGGDAAERFMAIHAQQVQSAKAAAQQADASAAASKQRLQTEQDITTEKQRQNALDDQHTAQSVVDTTQVQNVQAETTAMNDLLLKINAVEQAVQAKTAAFKAEGVAVDETVNKEITALTQLKTLLDNIQNTLQIVFASNSYNLGDINATQDKTSSNALPNILQTIQSTLEQIYGVLKGFTGIEADNKNSVKYKEPVVENNVVDSDAYKLIASKMPEDVSTETTLSAIKGAVDQLAKSPDEAKDTEIKSDPYELLSSKLSKDLATEGTLSAIKSSVDQLANKTSDDEKSGENSLGKLVASLLVATTELKNVANGIVQHQKAAKSDTSVAQARITDPKKHQEIVDKAKASIENLGTNPQIRGLKALANGLVQVEGAFKNASGTWEGFTVRVNEAGEAMNLTTDTQSAFAKALKNLEDNGVKYSPDETYQKALEHMRAENKKGKKTTLQYQDSGRYTVSSEEDIGGGLSKKTFQTFDEFQQAMSRTTVTLSNNVAVAIKDANKLITENMGQISNADLLQKYNNAYAELITMNNTYGAMDTVPEANLIKWNQQIAFVQQLGGEITSLIKTQQKLEGQQGVVTSAQRLKEYQSKATKMFGDTGIGLTGTKTDEQKDIIAIYDQLIQKISDFKKSNAVLTDGQLAELEALSEKLKTVTDAYNQAAQQKVEQQVFDAQKTDLTTSLDEYTKSIKASIVLTSDLENKLIALGPALENATNVDELKAWENVFATVKQEIIDFANTMDVVRGNVNATMNNESGRSSGFQKRIDEFGPDYQFGSNAVNALNDYRDALARLSNASNDVWNANDLTNAEGMAKVQVFEAAKQACDDYAKALSQALNIEEKIQKNKATSKISGLSNSLTKDFKTLGFDADTNNLSAEQQDIADTYKAVMETLAEYKVMISNGIKVSMSAIEAEISNLRDKMKAYKTSPGFQNAFTTKQQKQVATFKTDSEKLKQTIAIPDSFIQRIKAAGDAIKNAVNNNELQIAQNNWAALRKEIELTAMQQNLYIKKSVVGGNVKKNAYGATPVINAQAKFNALSPRAKTYIDQFGSDVVSDVYSKYEESFKRLIALQNQLQNAPSISDAHKVQFTELKNECNEYYKELKKIIDASEKFASDAEKNIQVMGDIDVNDSHGRGNALKEYVQEAYGAKATIQGFNSDMTQLKFTLKNTDGTITQMTAAFDVAKTHIGSLRGETKKTTGIFELFAGKTKELWTYMAARMGVDELIQAIRTGIQYVREIDSALTELKKVTDETDASYDRFLQNMSKTASAIGSTVSELTTMAAEWARLGYSMEEAGMLAESTAILLNVSEFSDATAASEALISTMQAFGYAADESQHVVDVLNEVGNNFAISSDGLATALQDSASALMEAGNTLEQSVALIAAANKVVQDPDSVGSALRTISLRLRGTSVSVLEELGEETDGAVESVSKLQEKVQALSGVNILDATGSYKDTYTILKEIGTVWEDMSDIDQAKCCLCVQKCA